MDRPLKRMEVEQMVAQAVAPAMDAASVIQKGGRGENPQLLPAVLPDPGDIRFCGEDINGKSQWQCYLPNDLIVMNGVNVPVLPDEIDDTKSAGSWKFLKNILGDPHDPITAIGIAVFPDTSVIAPGAEAYANWRVYPVRCHCKFTKVTESLPPEESGSNLSLVLCDVIGYRVVNREHVGTQAGDTVMGDADNRRYAETNLPDQKPTTVSIMNAGGGKDNYTLKINDLGIGSTDPAEAFSDRPVTGITTGDLVALWRNVDGVPTVLFRRLIMPTVLGGDANKKPTTQKSILLRTDNYLEIYGIAGANATVDSQDSMVIRHKDAYTGEIETRVAEIVSSIPDPVDTSPYIELGPHEKDSEIAMTSSWSYWDDGAGRSSGVPHGFKSYEYVEAWDPTSQHILYRFYRIRYHDSHGRLQKITDERVTPGSMYREELQPVIPL